MEYLMTKTQVVAHVGHDIEFTEEARIVCTTCDETVWSQGAVNERGRKVSKEFYARMREEDPDRYRKINREKGQARRARIKADPVKYAEYLEKVRGYNKTASEKRKAAE